MLANRNCVVVAFLTSAFSTFSSRLLHTRLFYGIFMRYFLYSTGSSQAFNQLQEKVASGNFSARSFLANNSRVQCCNVNYWLGAIFYWMFAQCICVSFGQIYRPICFRCKKCITRDFLFSVPSVIYVFLQLALGSLPISSFF